MSLELVVTSKVLIDIPIDGSAKYKLWAFARTNSGYDYILNTPSSLIDPEGQN